MAKKPEIRTSHSYLDKGMVGRYKQRMEEIVHRLESIDAVMEKRTNLLYYQTAVEFVYLQFRLILENIATLWLEAAGEEKKQAVEDMVRNEWNAKEIIAALSKINPDFYPAVPNRLQPDDEAKKKLPKEMQSQFRGKFENVEASNYLTKERWITLYDKSSQLIHAGVFQSRLLTMKQANSLLNQARRWRKLIYDLLRHHRVLLGDERDDWLMVIAQLNPQSYGGCRITEFVREDKLEADNHLAATRDKDS